MKKAAKEIAARARQSIATTREIVTSGSPRASVTTSGSARAHVVSSARSLETGSIGLSMGSIGFGAASSVPGRGAQLPVVSLDSIEVSMGSLGVSDSTACSLVLSMPADKIDEISIVKIFRADLGPAKNVPMPSGRAIVDLTSNTTTRKDNGSLWRTVAALSASSVASHLSTIVRDDRTTPFRTATGDSGELRPQRPSLNGRTVGSEGLLTIDGVDSAVLSSPSFFLNRKNLGRAPMPSLPSTVSVGATMMGPDSAAIVPGGSSADALDLKTLEFKEISAVAVRRSSLRSVGDSVELVSIDPSTSYGCRYAYYAIGISSEMRTGNRSKIVSVDVVNRKNSCSPVTGSFVVSDGLPRFLVSSCGADKFEVYAKGSTRNVAKVIGRPGSMTSDVQSSSSSNGFKLIAEIPANNAGSSVFYDRFVTPGSDVTYRFYAVDGFGHKFQTPYEASVRAPDIGGKVRLNPPVLVVDIAPDGRSLNVSVSCDDAYIVGFRVMRRDVSMHENGFNSPNEPSSCTLTQRDAKRRNSVIGPRLIGPDAWNGYLQTVDGKASFNDKTVLIDRTYQYIVEGIDTRGNIAGPSLSEPIGIFVRDVAKSPSNVSVSYDGASVTVSWDQTTIDVLPEEMLGSVSRLADSAVRTVYQVERREIATNDWFALQPTSASSYVDTIGDVSGPTRHTGFDYRVIAMKQDGIISPYSSVVSVKTDLVPSNPENVRASMTSIAVKPVAAILSWTYEGTEVDKWEVERAAVNKFAAGNVGTIVSMSSLSFQPIATITRESSRGLAAGADDPSTAPGVRQFIDHDISMENALFYRVRAISIGNQKSGWVMRGIIPTDSPYDKKLSTTITSEQRRKISSVPSPIKHRGGLR